MEPNQEEMGGMAVDSLVKRRRTSLEREERLDA